MKVIADLYGEGDPNHKHAKREFREIKEAVLIDVSATAQHGSGSRGINAD